MDAQRTLIFTKSHVPHILATSGTEVFLWVSWVLLQTGLRCLQQNRAESLRGIVHLNPFLAAENPLSESSAQLPASPLAPGKAIRALGRQGSLSAELTRVFLMLPHVPRGGLCSYSLGRDVL